MRPVALVQFIINNIHVLNIIKELMSLVVGPEDGLAGPFELHDSSLLAKEGLAILEGFKTLSEPGWDEESLTT